MREQDAGSVGCNLHPHHYIPLNPTYWTFKSNNFFFLIHSLVFTIKNITLSIEPSTDVTRDTNVTLRCRAIVSSSGSEALSCEYTIYKDSSTVYTKISSTSEDLLYLLPQARVSNTGKYKCAINIDGKQMTSPAKKLTVTGQFTMVAVLSVVLGELRFLRFLLYISAIINPNR